MFRSHIIFLCTLLLSATSALSQELVYCGERVPTNFNPQSSQDWWTAETVTGPVFEQLLEFDSATQTVGPMLAINWEANDGLTRYVLTLREGVMFQPNRDGYRSELTSQDVVATFSMLSSTNNVDREDIDELMTQRNLTSLGQIENVKAINNHTVEFSFGSPQPSFLADLSDGIASIWPEEIANQIS